MGMHWLFCWEAVARYPLRRARVHNWATRRDHLNNQNTDNFSCVDSIQSLSEALAWTCPMLLQKHAHLLILHNDNVLQKVRLYLTYVCANPHIRIYD